ncbi:MAG: NRDE family protein [Cyclobacteriaceae bacterium]|nr:NRDE family protein [Cyclobacteriaceae bacterium]
MFLSVNEHPRYKLILAGNRDEFHQRRTAPASFWPDVPHVLAGRDLEANGTWLGISRKGRISLLTNFRDPANINPSAPSRGHLVSDYLMREVEGEIYLREVMQRGREYNGFNLLVGTPDRLWYYSNYAEGIHAMTDGLHGLSNHLLNTPWPKVERGKQLLSPLLRKETVLPEELLDLLYDEEQAPDDALPDTGVGIERERVLSSMFIKSPNYGSRCSTVILVDRQNQVHFAERVYDLTTFAHSTRQFEFAIE